MKLNKEIVNRINQVAVEFITGGLNEPLVEAIQRIAFFRKTFRRNIKFSQL
jgi:hypothetical protein